MRSKKLAVLYRKADRQLGLVTTCDLRDSGFSRPAISRLATDGSIIPVHRGVYRLPGSASTIQQRSLAAALACGKDAVISGRTAAELWRILESPKKEPIEITLPRGRRAEHTGVVVHRALELPKRDVTRLGPVPITRIARTLRDLPRALKEDAFDEALRQRRIVPNDFVDEPGYLGKLARDRSGLGVPHEKIERRAVALFKRFKVPPPRRQYWVEINGERYRIDLAYPAEKIAIELLGEAAHWGRKRFQSDIDRRNALELDGWHQIDFSWFDLTRDQAKVVSTVLGMLARATSAD